MHELFLRCCAIVVIFSITYLSVIGVFGSTAHCIYQLVTDFLSFIIGNVIFSLFICILYNQ